MKYLYPINKKCNFRFIIPAFKHQIKEWMIPDEGVLNYGNIRFTKVQGIILFLQVGNN
jgi:hypothetical protein